MSAESRFEELETPALLVDLDVLEANLRAMAELAARHGVTLRPHFKTHKCIEIAERQIALGAVGGTVAKPSEAAVFAAAGVRSLLVATPVVDAGRIRRLIEGAGDVEILGLVESEAGLAAWAEAGASAGRRLPVLLEVDTGLGRTGVAPGEAALPLARRIAANRNVSLRGVMTHGGHAYGVASPAAIPDVGRREGEDLVATAGALRAAGLPCEVVSVGSTPTAPHAAAVPGVTELRPGNYVFHDGIQSGLGVAPFERCALTVLATVISRPAPDRLLLDCGSKTLSSDGGSAVKGYGCLLGAPSLVLSRLWEEHAVVPVDERVILKEGDRVRVVPNHACATVNLHDELVVVRGSRIEGRWRVAARGRVR